MVRRYILLMLLVGLTVAVGWAQKHTEFVRLPLTLTPEEMALQLEQKGLQREDSTEFSGRIAGLDVWLHIEANRDTTGCGHLMLTTQEQQGRSLHDDYVTLMKWLQRHYGKPTWEGTVRSYPFARWFVDFDHDIVLMTTASNGIEIWFYENHDVRSIDYYSILKYCERHPVDGVPYYSAWEQKTWKTLAPVVTERKVAKKHKRHHRPRHHAKKRPKRRRR